MEQCSVSGHLSEALEAGFNLVKRKHHFVPKFYLEAFRSEKRRINLYNLGRSLSVRNASLRAQCYRHKFYGSDDATENALAVLEDWFSHVLRGIRSKGALPPVESDEHLCLLTFGAMQILRTPKNADRLNRMIDKVTKQAYSNAAAHNGLDTETTRIGFEDPVLIALSNLRDLQVAISDLNVHLVVSRNDSFLTSDNPAFKYNQYCEKIQYQGVTGAAQRGLQIFIPLSPRHHLVFYDGITYKAKAGQYTRCCAGRQSDIDQLNTMQLVSADENIYFSDWQERQEIARLLPTAEHLRMPDPTVVLEYGQDNDPNSSLLHTYERVENMSLNLSFLGFRGHALRVPLGDRPHQYRNDHRSATQTGTGEVVTFSRFIGRR